MMRGLIAASEHPERRHLGVYHFVMTARVIDTVNANPMTSYIDLHELLFIPGEIFYQVSDHPAVSNEPFRILQKLVTYALSHPAPYEEKLIRWSPDGRYLEAKSLQAIEEVIKASNTPIPGDEFVTAQDRISEANILENLEKTGLRIFKVHPAQNSDYLIRLWSPLLIRTRPDLMSFLNPGSNWSRMIRESTQALERGITDTADNEPDWTSLPALPFVDEQELLERYTGFGMWDRDFLLFVASIKRSERYVAER